MFHDLMLKFADEGEANAVLFTDGTPNYLAIDTLGVLYQKAPDPLPEDYVLVPLDGWHVNVRHNAEMPELQAFVVDPPPAVPRRVWA